MSNAGSYEAAFYDVAKLLDIGARSKSPADVWRNEMLPKLKARLARTVLTADAIVHVNAFLTHMAEHFRERTSRRFLGLRVTMMQPTEAMSYALATFDASLDMLGVAFGDPEYGWDRDHAHELVDEELRHWEA